MTETLRAPATWRPSPPATWPKDGKATRIFDYATILFAAGFMFHNVDHLRRGVNAVTHEVLIEGTLLSILSITAIGLVIARHRLAPMFAMVVGFIGAPGVAAVHLLPTWSAFSDSFPSGHVDNISWAAAISEVVALFLFGCAGLYVRRRDRALLAS